MYDGKCQIALMMAEVQGSLHESSRDRQVQVEAFAGQKKAPDQTWRCAETSHVFIDVVRLGMRSWLS